MDSSLIQIQFDIVWFISGISLSVIMAFISYRLRALSISGAAGMIIVGSIVFGLGGVVFAIPLILFFVSSSLLSKIKTSDKEKSMEMFDKSGPRDIYQVLANGGVGALAVLMFFVTNNTIWFFIYLSSICEAAADTWATELGTISRKKPISIISFRKIEAGSSGGVSLLGTASAAGGSLMIAGFSYLFSLSGTSSQSPRFESFIAVFIFGFIGALIDSLIGATIQSQFQCDICYKTTEQQWHCGKRSMLIRGFRAVNNDVVNFLSTTSAAVLMGLYFYFTAY